MTEPSGAQAARQDRVHVAPEQLADAIATGEIDTVVDGVPRSAGPARRQAHDRALLPRARRRRGHENCDYLIACDMDNNPVPGYRFASYEQGYGDMLAVADSATDPRHARGSTAPRWCMCDLRRRRHRRADRGRAAHRSCAGRRRPPPRSGYTPMVASEIEFYLFHDTLRRGPRQGLPRPARRTRRGSRTTTSCRRRRTSTSSAQIRRGLEAAGVPVRVLQGRGRPGPARDQPRLHRRRSRWPTATASTRPRPRRSPRSTGGRSSFMAKYDFDDTGSSLPHPLQPVVADGTTGAVHGRPPRRARDERRCSASTSAGLIATAQEFSLLWAPTINSYKRFQPGSWAPTGVGWGDRQPHARLPQGRPRRRHQGRVPHPRAATPTATSPSPATIAGGLYGIRHQIEPPAPFVGNGYDDHDLARIPWNLRRRDRPVGGLGRRQGGLRRRRPPPHPQHAPARSGWRSTAASPTGSCPATSNVLSAAR